MFLVLVKLVLNSSLFINMDKIKPGDIIMINGKQYRVIKLRRKCRCTCSALTFKACIDTLIDYPSLCIKPLKLPC